MDTSPHKSGFVTVNDIQLHYLDWGGNGPVLLFLAGIGNNAHIFDGFAPRFTDQFRVLALTRRGHGESDYPQSGYDIDTLTEDIRLFLDCLHIDRVILVQHTNEGIELPHFAALYPERVLKLVLLEPAFDRNAPAFKAMMDAWMKIDQEVRYPVESEAYSSLDDYVYQHNQYFPVNAASWCEAREEDLRHQMEVSPEGKIVYKAASGVGKARETMFRYTPEFSKMRAPVLAIFPIRPSTYYITPFMSPAQQEQMQELYRTLQLPWFRFCIDQFRRDVPHARILEIPDSHTYVFITHEEQVFNAMRAFLAE